MEKEIFKDIKGYEGLYQISNFGRVKSLSRKRNENTNAVIKERILTPDLGKAGYHSICFKVKNKTEKYLIHRLVAIHFIHNTENKPQVNHINGIKNDNRLENLECVTISENRKHAYNTGLQFGPIGEKQGSSKLTESQILEIKERLNKKEKQVNIAMIYNVRQSNISKIKNNKRWNHLNNQ
jgi:hypothetical protein